MKWVSDKVSEAWGGEKCESWHKNRTEPTRRRRRRRNLRQTKMLNDKVSERQLWQTAAPESERENWDELRGERRICGRRGRRLLGTAESKKPLQKGEQQTVMTRWLLLLMKLLTKFHFFLFFFIVLLCTCHLISILSLPSSSSSQVVGASKRKIPLALAAPVPVFACRSLHCGNEAGTTTTSVSEWQW